MLYRNRQFYINGEILRAQADRPALRRLADQRCISGYNWSATTMPTLYEWYLAGYVVATECVRETSAR